VHHALPGFIDDCLIGAFWLQGSEYLEVAREAIILRRRLASGGTAPRVATTALISYFGWKGRQLG
jgi:hypothetical protein